MFGYGTYRHQKAFIHLKIDNLTCLTNGQALYDAMRGSRVYDYGAIARSVTNEGCQYMPFLLHSSSRDEIQHSQYAEVHVSIEWR